MLSGGQGGAANIDQAHFEDCLFEGNLAERSPSVPGAAAYGGGVCLTPALPALTNLPSIFLRCAFQGNRAGLPGATTAVPPPPTSPFPEPGAASYGGALYSDSMNATLTNCTFTSNEVSGGTHDAGAAIAVQAAAVPAPVGVQLLGSGSGSSSSGAGCLLAENAVRSGRQYWHTNQLLPLLDPGLQWFADPASGGNASVTVAPTCAVRLRCQQYLSCAGCTGNASCGWGYTQGSVGYCALLSTSTPSVPLSTCCTASRCSGMGACRLQGTAPTCSCITPWGGNTCEVPFPSTALLNEVGLGGSVGLGVLLGGVEYFFNQGTVACLAFSLLLLPFSVLRLSSWATFLPPSLSMSCNRSTPSPPLPQLRSASCWQAFPWRWAAPPATWYTSTGATPSSPAANTPTSTTWCRCRA